MEFNETLELEIINKPSSQFFIAEENFKGKRTNRNFKIGKSFQYYLKNYVNRFLIWNTNDNFVTITELSTDFELMGNQIEIEFQKSQVLSVSVFETDIDIQFLISTSLLVMRFSLHHPNKLRHPENFQYSIFYGLSDLNEMKHSITPYFNANEITSVNSIIDNTNNSNIAYFNYGLSNGNIYTFVIQESVYPESFHYFEMKEGSLLSKFISGFMFTPKSSDYNDLSVQDMTYVELNGQYYLVTISKDNKLKLWSLKDRYCIVSEDLLESVLLSSNSNRTMSTINFNSIISSHRIKSLLNTNVKGYHGTVVVYFHITLGKTCLTSWIMIEIMDPHDRINSKQPIQIISTINETATNLNLIDFEIGTITNKDKIGIWSLVSDKNSERACAHAVHWISLSEEDELDSNFSCRIYNGSNELDVHIEDYQDPQEAIINKIFTPGVLLRSAIVNTLNKYMDVECQLTSKASIDELKQNMVLIAESKVEQELLSYLDEGIDVDVMELSRNRWYCMLKECVEEHYVLMEPLGIILVAGTIGLNRFGAVSLMRSPNAMEQILSTTGFAENLYRFYDRSHIVSGVTLLKYLNDVARHIQATQSWSQLEHNIFKLGMRPMEVVKTLLSTQIDIPSVIDSRLDSQPDIIENTIRLLETLDIEADREFDSSVETYRMSSFSIGLLHYASCQVIRDKICLSLAMINLLVPRILYSSQSAQLHKSIQRLECLVNSLISIHWLLTLRQRSSTELTDLQKGQLESLNLMENRCPDLIGSDILCLRILQSLQIRCSDSNTRGNSWQSRLTNELSMVFTYLNPTCNSFSIYQICKYFLSYNMPLELIEYLKFLKASQPDCWWSSDDCFVQVMIALSYLLLNQPWKFVDCLTEAISMNDIPSSLLSGILFIDNSNITSVPILQTNLLLKFIDVMDDTPNSEPFVITLAECGIKIIDDSSDEELVRYKSILMTILFKNFLDVGRFNEARLAIMNNPDVDKQKDCLRQLIIVLSDCQQLDMLVQFDYGNLSEEFVTVVHSRARASDLADSKDPFYNVLYAFHVKNCDYKAAASCMLELGLRLDYWLQCQGIYMSNQLAIDHLQKQLNAYLTCISLSSLLSSGDQLFVFPASIASSFAVTERPMDQLRNTNFLDHQPMDISMESGDTNQCGTDRVIINLMQIKQQYNLIRCRLKIIRDGEEHGIAANGKLTNTLTISGLLKMGLYWDAINLSNDLKMSLEPVISAIATRCAQVSKNCLDRPLMKEKENVIDSLEEMNGKCDFASMGSLQKLLWKFLEEVLVQHDKTPHGDLCLKACSKLLSGGIDLLPSWLIDIVVRQKQAPAHLLRLYICNGYLEPAVNLSARILDEQIDELYQLHERSIYFRDNTVPTVQPKWNSLPAVLGLLDILEKMVTTHNEPRAIEFYERLEQKMRIMVSLLQQDTTVLTAIQ